MKKKQRDNNKTIALHVVTAEMSAPASSRRRQGRDEWKFRVVVRASDILSAAAPAEDFKDRLLI